MTPAENALTPVAQATQQATTTVPPGVPEPIPLQFPVTKGDGSKLTTITLRRATVKELRTMKRFGPDLADQELGTVAELAGLIPEDLDMVDARDYARVQKAFRELLGGSS